MNERPKRKSKGPDFRVYVATSFPHANFCEIEKLAKEYGLRNAQIVRELFLRGLAAYHNDGKLCAEEVVNDEAEAATEFPADSPRNAAVMASRLRADVTSSTSTPVLSCTT